MRSTEPHSRMFSVSSRLYRWMLLAYPQELRSEFGREIAKTFDRQLSDSWDSKRMWGVISLWTCVILEFFSIAIAYRVTLLAVPCISTIITAIAFSALMAMSVPSAQDFVSTNKAQPILITRFGGDAHNLPSDSYGTAQRRRSWLSQPHGGDRHHTRSQNDAADSRGVR